MHHHSTPQTKTPTHLPMFMLAIPCLLLAVSAASAQLMVDDFVEVSGAFYPLSRTWPNITTSLDDTPLSTTASNLRRIFPQPVPSNSTVTDASGTVNIDPVAGRLEWSTTQTAKGGVLIGWLSNDPNNHMNLDVSTQTELVVEYADVSRQLLMTIRLSNAVDGDVNSTAGNQIDVVLEPTLGPGEFRFALDDMGPFGELPDTDRTSVDAIAVDFLSNDFGTSFTVTSVYFVPEPVGRTSLLFPSAWVPFVLRKKRRYQLASKSAADDSLQVGPR